MINKFIPLVVLSTFLFAHSQTPTKYGGEENKLDSISTQQIKIIPLTIQNLNKYHQSYNIEVDGDIVGSTNMLISKQILRLKIPVTIYKRNKLENHSICTISIARTKDEMFNTKICTKVLLYWTDEK